MADASFATAWQRDDLDAARPGIPGAVERYAGRRAAVLPAEPAQWWRGCACRLVPPGDGMARQRSRRAMACGVLPHVSVSAEIGSASCGARGGLYVWILVVAG